MFKLNFLLFFRNLKRFQGTFFINLIGLSSGLACFLLIYLWVSHERHVDNFHQNNERLFQLIQNIPLPDKVLTTEGTPGLLSKTLLEEFPQVEYTTALVSPSLLPSIILSYREKNIKVEGQMVGEDFFNVFSYKLTHGDKGQVLKEKNAVVISQKLALTLFNTTENVVGKMLEWKGKEFAGLYIVSGIFENMPSASSQQVDALFNYELFLEKRPHFREWTNSNPRTYVVLKEETDTKAFNSLIAGLLKSKDENAKGSLFLTSYADHYLYGSYENGIQSGGRILYVKLFSLIGSFILLIACINFTNLATAQAARRIKEVGIKKSIGASRRTLILQFLSESILMAFVSLVVALLLVVLILPSFSEVTGKELALELELSLLLSITTITLLTGLLAGSYPAFYLSGFKPVKVLKNKMDTTFAQVGVRKALVVFQYSLSAIFIVSVLVINKQLDFVQSTELGYDKDNMILFKREGKLNEGLETFLAEVKKIPGVVNASNMGYDLKSGHGSTYDLSWEGKHPDEKIEFWNLEISYDLIETIGYELKEGRTFSREFGADSSAIILNEAAIAAMGLKDPVGKTLKLWNENRLIVGVLKDFHFQSLHEKVKPCFFRLSTNGNTIVVKLKGGSMKETLSKLDTFYKTYTGGLSFEYTFMDQAYQELYAAEKKVSLLAGYFTAIALLISCLGLFGLAFFTAQRRRKEIGIRKVLGSSQLSIVVLLSEEFTKLVLVAIVIALPISYLLSSYWLDSFAYRIPLQPWLFLGAGLITLLVAWLTVGYQTLKASRVNPIQTLREE